MIITKIVGKKSIAASPSKLCTLKLHQSSFLQQVPCILNSRVNAKEAKNCLFQNFLKKRTKDTTARYAPNSI